MVKKTVLIQQKQSYLTLDFELLLAFWKTNETEKLESIRNIELLHTALQVTGLSKSKSAYIIALF